MNRDLPPDEFAQPSPQPTRRRALRLLQRGFHYTRAETLYLRLTDHRGVVVLLYHSVPGPDVARFIVPGNRMQPALFAREMEFIARHRRVLDIDSLLLVLQGEMDPEPGSVVLTFDDGYRDNATFVAPLLASLGLPATLYLPTHLVARGESSWVDLLYCAFRYRTRNHLDLPDLGSRRYALHRSEDRREAFSALSSRLIATNLETRASLLAQVIDRLSPSEMSPRLTMNWGEVRELRRRYPLFRFGAHGAEHLDLTSQPEEVVRTEISNCRNEFESALGEKPIHFAFPYNRSNEAVCAVLAQNGFESGMSGGDAPLLGSHVNPLQMSRFDAPHDLGLLGHWTSGAHPGISKLLLFRS